MIKKIGLLLIIIVISGFVPIAWGMKCRLTVSTLQNHDVKTKEVDISEAKNKVLLISQDEFEFTIKIKTCGPNKECHIALPYEMKLSSGSSAAETAFSDQVSRSFEIPFLKLTLAKRMAYAFCDGKR